MTEATVRFLGERCGILSLLEVEASGGQALFAVLARTLFLQRVQIVRAESRCLAPGRHANRMWIVEFDGAPIGKRRRLSIQVEILRAVENEYTRVQVSQVLGIMKDSSSEQPIGLET